MKKFLGKKSTMITFVVLSVVLLVFYIGMLVRPVAIGFTYKGEFELAPGQTMEMEIKATSGSKANIKIKVDGASIEMEDVRYVAHDEEIYLMFNLMTGEAEKMSDSEFKAQKKEILKNWDVYEEGALDVNAFVMGDDEDSLTCAGSIVFAVVAGLVVAAVLTFGTLSLVAFTKKRK